MKEIEITKEPVELYKILKFEGIVAALFHLRVGEYFHAAK